MRRISVCNFLGSFATKKTLPLLSYYCIHGLVGWWTCAGGNEYGQCAEELGRHMEGKLLHRDISIPQRCCPRLRVRQVWINGSRISALCLFSHWPQPISIANPTSFYQIRGCLWKYCYFTQSTSFHDVCHNHRNSLPIDLMIIMCKLCRSQLAEHTQWCWQKMVMCGLGANRGRLVTCMLS